MNDPAVIFGGEVYADHWQIWLTDADSSLSSGPRSREQDYRRRLAAGSDWIKILTAVYADVRLTVELLNGPPSEDLSAWDHVAEASFSVPSGIIRIGNDESDSATVAVPPGSYRARVHYGNIDHEPDGLENPFGEHYRVALWPAPPTAIEVLRQGPSWF